MSSNIIKRPEDQVAIYQGDDARRIEEARQEFLRASSQVGRAPRREGDASPAQQAADAVDAIKAEALPRAVWVTVRALPRKAYRHLLAAHPPRNDNDDDETLGYNQDTFLDALLEYFDAGEKTVVDPDFATRDSLVEWLNNLNDGNYTQLAIKAVEVNQGGSPDPKVSLGSQVARLFAATSPSPDTTG